MKRLKYIFYIFLAALVLVKCTQIYMGGNKTNQHSQEYIY